MSKDPKPPVCYCGSTSILRTGKWGFWYACSNFWCEGAIGCHKGTKTPLGPMANKATRQARILAHDAFDALWKPLGRGWRIIAYRWLGAQLGIEEPHMGHMDEETALSVADLCGNAGPEDLVEYRYDNES